MAKFPTSPLLYDEVLTLSITDLKRLGFLKNNHTKGGGIFWNRNGEETASISVNVDTDTPSPFIELSYEHDGVAKRYRIPLVTIPSNLGIGRIYYFLCPVTKKRCRKLYLVNDFFLHRDTFKGMYKKQTEPKKWRRTRKVLERHFALDDIYEKIYSKHFRTHYAGRPTKRYLRLIKKIDTVRNINPFELRRMLQM